MKNRFLKLLFAFLCGSLPLLASAVTITPTPSSTDIRVGQDVSVTFALTAGQDEDIGVDIDNPNACVQSVSNVTPGTACQLVPAPVPSNTCGRVRMSLAAGNSASCSVVFRGILPSQTTILPAIGDYRIALGGCTPSCGLTGSLRLLAADTPPQLTFNPTSGTIGAPGAVTRNPDNSFSTINVGTQGGSGTTDDATTTLACSLNKPAGAVFAAVNQSVSRGSFNAATPAQTGTVSFTGQCAPTATQQTATLQCDEKRGVAASTAQIWSLVCPPTTMPTSTGFAFGNSSGSAGSDQTLSWTSNIPPNATCSVTGLGAPGNLGQQQRIGDSFTQTVRIPANATGTVSYTLSCAGVIGTPPTATFNVTPAVATGAITSFFADPSTGASGAQTRLTWVSTGITANCTLTGTGVTTASVPANGNQNVIVAGPPGVQIYRLDCGAGIAQETNFTITAPGTIPTANLAPVSRDPIAATVIQPVVDICRTTPTDPVCIAVANPGTAPDAIVAAFRAIASEEASVTVSSSKDNLNFVNTGASSRLSALRGGATRTSVDDVAIMHDGRSIPTGAVVGALGALLGLTQDSAEEPGGGLLSDRWGFFMTGIFRDGDRDAVLQPGCVVSPTNTCLAETGFGFDGWQALAGLDYRFSPQFVAGIAVGGGKIDAELDANGGALESRSRLGTIYASYLPSDNWYIDMSYARLNNRYEQSRVIDLRSLAPTSTPDAAFGKTRGSQNNFSIASGYVFSGAATSFTPNVRFSKGKTVIDGFAESGSSNFNLRLPEQEFNSTQFALGFNVNRAVSLESGVLLPYLNIEMIREQDNERFTIGCKDGEPTTIQNCVTFVRPGVGGALIRGPNIEVAEADSSFGRAELGFTFVREGGWQFGLSYLRTFAFEYLSSQSLQMTGRIEF
jgi:uncharacterized protein YhjY with autotransporter beta-barrel domain